MTEPLFEIPALVELTDRQQAAYEYISEHGPCIAWDVGAHLAKTFGWSSGHEQENGNAYCKALRKKGVVRLRRGLGWVSTADESADDRPGPSNEIPF